jgi:hypothetical protein
MTQLSMKRELKTSGMHSSGRQLAEVAWRWFVNTIQDPALVAVIAFCAIGLLATLCLVVRFPEWMGN